MVIFMGNRSSRTDEGAAETGNAVIDRGHNRLLRLFVKDKTIGGTDIETEPAAPAGLVMNGHLQHLLIPPQCSDGRAVPGDRNIQLHSAHSMGGAGQTGVVTADDEFQPVQNRLVVAVPEETSRPLL